MSRIDDALKRLTGAETPETRTSSMLDRYASEGPARMDERAKPHRIEEAKTPKFGAVPPKPRPVEPPRVASVPTPRPAPAVAAPAPEPRAAADAEVSSDPIVDVKRLLNYVVFVLRSVKRHKLLAASAVVLVLTLTGAAVILLPKTYHVQTKLFAQRNAVMAALSNPGRAVPWDADAPTRAAAETVLRRDNLISLITQTDLINEWDRRRAPILKLKDWVVAKVTGYTLTPDDKLDALVDLLETRMIVEAGPVGDGTVTIDLDWPDAEMGYKLVQSAQQTFLEARQAAETAAIGESISILERYSQSLHENISRTLTDLERTQGRKAGGAARPRPALTAQRRPSTALTVSLPPRIAATLGESLTDDPALARLKTSLTTKRLELGRLEEARQRQVAELQQKLTQLKTVYTPNHPSVVAAERNLAIASQDEPQALALAAEIEELQADYDKRFADATELQDRERREASASAEAAVASAAPRLTEAAPEPAPRAPQAADSEAEFASLRLRAELNQLNSVLERADGARIELAVSQAAFKYRYTVIRPAQIPRDPVSPNIRMVFAAGVFASLFLALAVAVSKDILSNRILEGWQVEQQLGLPVLGSVRSA